MNPTQEWPGEYPLLTKIWGKWFKEMSIDTFSFIKNENIGEVRESMEKFMQIKLSGKIEPAQWTNIALPDSNNLAVKTSTSVPSQQTGSGGTLTAQAYKKKDESVIKDSSNIYDRIATRTSTVKRPIKQKEQVSFGPVY